MSLTPKVIPDRRAPNQSSALCGLKQVQSLQQSAQNRLQQQHGDSLDELRKMQAQAQQQQMARHRRG